MPWTPVTSLTSPNTIPSSVDARLTVLDTVSARILRDLDAGPVSEDTRIQLRSNARFLEGLAREIRNDLGIT